MTEMDKLKIKISELETMLLQLSTKSPDRERWLCEIKAMKTKLEEIEKKVWGN